MAQLPEVVSRTEIRDGMKITWHQAIPMDDGLVLRADLFAPIHEGKYPVILSYGVYAKGLAYQDGYPHQWRRMVEDHPGDPRGLHEQVPELGSHRPRALDSARLRRHPRGLARRRLVARPHGLQQPARDPGHLSVHRVGGDPAVEQRQGRDAGHLLLREQPVAGGGPASPASHGDHPVGRPERPLSRLGLPRRHPQRVPEALGPTPGGQHPVRHGRAGQEESQYR